MHVFVSLGWHTFILYGPIVVFKFQFEVVKPLA